MKIAYLANIRIPTEKAHGIQITKMCESFALLGHDVTLIVPDRRSPITESVFSYYGIRENFTIKGLPTWNPRRITKFSFRVQSWWYILCVSIVAIMRRDDLVYSREVAPLLLLAFFGRSFVWEVHTRKDSFVTRSLASRARRVIAISSGLADELVSFGTPLERITVAHDAIDPDEFPSMVEKNILRETLALPFSRPIVGYVGKYRTAGLPKGVDGGKGVDELMDAFVVMRARVPDALLLIVGLNSDELPAVRLRADLLGIAEHDRVLVEHVPHARALMYMSAADVLIMNYPNILHYARFMSPLKLFEYMASGTPIVSSDLPSVREVLDETCARLVPPGDTPALADGIAELLSDAEQRHILARAAGERVRARHTWLGRAKEILGALAVEDKHRHNQ